jgi:drug/metabolite transporter (DMT)-like permease
MPLSMLKFASQLPEFMHPRLSLFIGILCISFSPIMVKLAEVSGITAAFYRILFAFLLLVPYCLIKRKLVISRKDLIIAVIGGVVFAADIALWNISILESTATVSTVLANLAPVWVGLLSWLILKKRSGWVFWAGTAVAIAGMVILVGLSNLLTLKLNVGVMFALISSLLYAIYILITKNALQKVDTLTFMFYNMLAAAIFLFAVGIIRTETLSGFSGYTWLILILTGLFCQLIGWITINYAIKHLESTQVSLTLLSQSLVTALIAMLILHETLAFNEILGGFTILVGIAITFLKKQAQASIVD